jgi:hypothetical protein
MTVLGELIVSRVCMTGVLSNAVDLSSGGWQILRQQRAEVFFHVAPAENQSKLF